jgi:hypothetical protein
MICSLLAYVVCSSRMSPSATQIQVARMASMRAKAGTLPRVGAVRSGQGWYSSLAQTSIYEDLQRTSGTTRTRLALVGCGRTRNGYVGTCTKTKFKPVD